MSLPGVQGSLGSYISLNSSNERHSAENKSSFLPTPTPQMIYSQQVSPGTQKICYQTGNEKISISFRRKERKHIHIETGNQLIRIQARSGKWLFPSQGRGLCKAQFLSGFSHSLSNNFRAWATLL